MNKKTHDSVTAYLLLHDVVAALNEAVKLPDLYEWNKADVVIVEDMIDHLKTTMLEMPLGGFLKDRILKQKAADKLEEYIASKYEYSIEIEYIGLENTTTYYVVLDHLSGSHHLMQILVNSMRTKESFLLSEHFDLADRQKDRIINGALIASACVALASDSFSHRNHR